MQAECPQMKVLSLLETRESCRF